MRKMHPRLVSRRRTVFRHIRSVISATVSLLQVYLHSQPIVGQVGGWVDQLCAGLRGPGRMRTEVTEVTYQQTPSIGRKHACGDATTYCQEVARECRSWHPCRARPYKIDRCHDMRCQHETRTSTTLPCVVSLRCLFYEHRSSLLDMACVWIFLSSRGPGRMPVPHQPDIFSMIAHHSDTFRCYRLD